MARGPDGPSSSLRETDICCKNRKTSAARHGLYANIMTLNCLSVIHCCDFIYSILLSNLLKCLSDYKNLNKEVQKKKVGQVSLKRLKTIIQPLKDVFSHLLGLNPADRQDFMCSA